MWPWAYGEIVILFLFLRSSVAFVATRLSAIPFHAAKDRNDVVHPFTKHVIEGDQIQRISSVNCGVVAGTEVGLGALSHSQQDEHHH